MKRIIRPLALAALLGAPFLAQAEGTGLYVAPKIGFGQLNGYDLKNFYYDGGSKDVENFSVGSKSTYSGAIAVGYNFKSLGVPVRAELEYALFSDTKSNGKKSFVNDIPVSSTKFRSTLGINTLFVNGYYDFHNSSAFTPYVGLGVGLSFVDMKLKGRSVDSDGDEWSYSSGKKSTTNFAWNVGGGFSYALTKQIGLDLGYRFAWIGDGKTKKEYYDDGEYDYFKAKDVYVHQLLLGMRFSF